MLRPAQLTEICDALTALYREFDVPANGIYDYYGCEKPCCNPRALTIEVFRQRLEKIVHSYAADFSLYIGPSDIPPIRKLLDGLQRSCCEHVLAPDGIPSNTTSGIRQRWRCLNCSRTEYR